MANVASIGISRYLNKGPSKPVAAETCGRFYNSAAWTPTTLGWQYLTGGSIAMASDVMPTLNAAVTSTTSTSAITFNPSTGLFNLPVAGRYNFNITNQYVNNCSAANGIGYEFRLSVFSAPAWPAANTTAKTYGSNAGNAGALSGTGPANLASTTFIMTNESGLFYSGLFPANTFIAPLLYVGSTSAVQSGSSPFSFSVSSIYMEMSLEYALY